ncbi:hypothetical protein HK102_013461 [Quaeritorhiza haematococci]|nr:hypothetical protein HK102_013461 [Quaeritorhiza haematococci]
MKSPFTTPLSAAAVAGLFLLGPGCNAVSAQQSPVTPLVAKGINSLVPEYHPALGGKSEVFSPLNIAHALMLLAGGITPPNTALETLLGVSSTSALTEQGASLLNSILATGANVSLTSAVWLRERDFPAPTPPNYTALVESLRGGISRVPNITAEAVNTFVSNGTRGKIPEIVNDRDVKDASAVLASALYFQDVWAIKFIDDDNVKLTIQGEAVPAMTLERDLQYVENSNFLAVRVPFEHQFDAYFVMLAGRTAEQVSVKGLSSFNVTAQQLQSTRIKLSVPRSMEFESTIDLLELWKTIPKYDLITKGITFLNNPFNITKAIHKAKLKVDKDGAEGAAATVIIQSGTSAPGEPPKPKQILFDKPFLFQIVHRESSAVLFSSIYTRETIALNSTADRNAAGKVGSGWSVWVATMVSLAVVCKMWDR